MELNFLTEIKTKAFAKKIACNLFSGDVIGLNGPLGVGKTTFVRYLTEAISNNNERCRVTSPTFTLMNQYICNDNLIINHVDLYRIAGYSEFIDSGLEDIVLDTKSIAIIEWFDVLGNDIDFNAFIIDMNFIDRQLRKISIDPEKGINYILLERLL